MLRLHTIAVPKNPVILPLRKMTKFNRKMTFRSGRKTL